MAARPCVQVARRASVERASDGDAGGGLRKACSQGGAFDGAFGLAVAAIGVFGRAFIERELGCRHGRIVGVNAGRADDEKSRHFRAQCCMQDMIGERDILPIEPCVAIFAVAVGGEAGCDAGEVHHHIGTGETCFERGVAGEVGIDEVDLIAAVAQVFEPTGGKIINGGDARAGRDEEVAEMRAEAACTAWHDDVFPLPEVISAAVHGRYLLSLGRGQAEETFEHIGRGI